MSEHFDACDIAIAVETTQGSVDVNVSSPLPCPFCGGKATIYETKNGWYVDCFCSNCLVQPTL